MDGCAALTVLPGRPTFGRGLDGTIAAADRGMFSFGRILDSENAVRAVLGFATTGLRMVKS